MSTFLITNTFEDYSYKNSFGLSSEGQFLVHDYHKNSAFIKIDKKSLVSFMWTDLINLIATQRVQTFFMDDFDWLVNEKRILEKIQILPRKVITGWDPSTELEYGIVYFITLWKSPKT
jgi:hypothetical protein